MYAFSSKAVKNKILIFFSFHRSAMFGKHFSLKSFSPSIFHSLGHSLIISTSYLAPTMELNMSYTDDPPPPPQMHLPRSVFEEQWSRCEGWAQRPGPAASINIWSPSLSKILIKVWFKKKMNANNFICKKKMFSLVRNEDTPAVIKHLSLRFVYVMLCLCLKGCAS